MVANGSNEVGSSTILVSNTVPSPTRTPRSVQQVSVSSRLTQFNKVNDQAMGDLHGFAGESHRVSGLTLGQNSGTHFTPTPWDPGHRLTMPQDITSVWDKEVVEPVCSHPEGTGFYCNLFLVPK